MKKWIALLLALVMTLSFAACGGDAEEETKRDRTKKTTEDTEKPAPEGEELELDLFTLYYDAEIWEVDEDSVNSNSTWSKVTMTIPDGEGYETYVDIWASGEGLEDFREYLQNYDFEAEAYVDGDYSTVTIGGVEFLEYETEYWGEPSTRYLARAEEAYTTIHIEVLGVYGEEAEKLLENITFTLKDVNNEDIWPWDGEPFEADDVTETVGDFTVESTWIPFEEPFVTFETFENAAAVIGDTAYILSAGTLYTYDFTEVLELKDQEELGEEYTTIAADENGVLWLSGFMVDFIGRDGYNFGDELDYVAVAPNGQWGVSWFSGPDCKLLTIGEDIETTDVTFGEVDTIMNLNVDNDYIYVCGSDEEFNHHVYIYDKTGKLKMTLNGEDGKGLGSITFVAQVNGGFMGLDGNMREVVFWDAAGNWVGSLEDGDLFGTYYPWFCGAAVLNDGSFLVLMTDDRHDGSAMELVAFKVVVS